MPQSALGEGQNSTLSEKAGERVLRIGDEKPIRISAGHRILHHDGKCSRPHGHNYQITVKVTGTLSEEGWIVDKGDVTDVIDKWDHMFLVEDGDPLIDAFEASGDDDALVVLDHPPTAEVMAVMLEEQMVEAFPDSVSGVSVSVRETGELCAAY
ncbi:6-pyruvoyl trahydropterin synthase family protein [Halapricum hydrolyticum]|uniref:6-pyruvoyl tetrahydropterin synthase family protein n=1 Tax=Halapricum hydrolyticum TaxID=2979991 RepID=A0AAE3LF36_9EURY|nr:6-pyruvoyl tetrahydropterin synthase family protein [Halapricum hydrolyticum]MCU4717586.1 6-pyruvoyl tetrahydropterin synthase family protein [Halapricum hydrolyticum]MCU4726885.1 6-pyruvoyl tetrahydropterin synthase family protein [Halapricum hydrolyticum]